MSVLIDTGVLYAFLYAADERHREGTEIVKAVVRGRLGHPFVLDWAAAELFTLIRARRGGAKMERAAMELLWHPKSMGTILPAGPSALRGAATIFEKVTGRGFSFIDAGQVWAAREHSIPLLATFDTALAQGARRMGIEPVSRAPTA